MKAALEHYVCPGCREIVFYQRGGDAPRCDCGRLPPTGRYEYLPELVCLQCHEKVALVRLTRPTMRFTIPRTLRCHRCGGTPFWDGEYVKRLSDRRKLATYGAPLRGRPPKWLVERREEEERRLSSGGSVSE